MDLNRNMRTDDQEIEEETQKSKHFLSKNVYITFLLESKEGQVIKYTKILSNIKFTSTEDDIYDAVSGVAKLYEHDKFEIKITTTDFIDEDPSPNEELEEI